MKVDICSNYELADIYLSKAVITVQALNQHFRNSDLNLLDNL